MPIWLLRAIHDAGPDGLEVDFHDETGTRAALEEAERAGHVKIQWESWAGNFGVARLTNQGRAALGLDPIPSFLDKLIALLPAKRFSRDRRPHPNRRHLSVVRDQQAGDSR